MENKKAFQPEGQGFSRREILKAGIAGAAAAGITGMGLVKDSGSAMASSGSEFKRYAKEKWKGLETCIIPSFTPDLSRLDEEGVRWDVRQAIKHGFFSALGAVVDLSFEEEKKFVEIIADEAKEKILVSVLLKYNSIKQNVEMLSHAKKVGCAHAMLAYPPAFMPQSEEEIYQYTKKICDAVPIPVYIYSTQKFGLDRFHPSGLSPQLLSRIADIDNVVGLKLGSGDFAYISECFERCGDRILVNCPSVGLIPVLIRAYKQQWIGAAVYEMYQTPEKRYLADAYDLMLKGDMEKGLELFQKITPLVMLFQKQMMPLILIGSYHWALLKYYQWCVGGNGGLTRHPFRLYRHELMEVKMVLSSVGIRPRQPDDEFFAGRVNFSKKK